jgi:hypothetical protein
MTDAREKLVQAELFPLYSRSSYAADKFTNYTSKLGKGESIEIPSIADVAVIASGATGAAPVSATPSVLTLTANLDPMFNVKLSKIESEQNLGGNWAQQVAKDITGQMKNAIDDLVLRDYVCKQLCWDTSASYVDNVAGDALVDTDVLGCHAALTSQNGTSSNLGLFMSSYGVNSLRKEYKELISINPLDPAGVLGLPYVGEIHGVKVFQSNSVPRNITAAASATNIATNVCTATVPANHGFLAGMMIHTTGMTANIAAGSPVAITSVTATTIVFPLTAANGSNGTGSIVGHASLNVMADLDHLFVSMKEVPDVAYVKDYNSSNEALQITTVLGRIGRVGRARLLLSPGSSVT